MLQCQSFLRSCSLSGISHRLHLSTNFPNAGFSEAKDPPIQDGPGATPCTPVLDPSHAGLTLKCGLAQILSSQLHPVFQECHGKCPFWSDDITAQYSHSSCLLSLDMNTGVVSVLLYQVVLFLKSVPSCDKWNSIFAHRASVWFAEPSIALELVARS